ncbi:NAD(P)/FAD-dependent oxidoreductase [Candidatus Nanohalobium constans]|uniref:Thioredoxin reductase (NADPH) n=1 Tax=Candidatus Nanohalobium constans TaxID=2565781 RepID=A0A5Q0UFV5_9ARCH|nr:FAD-dependent oxidoreductase [Candidatus Nanohalobium constans]QGA80488.1 thioredoxin reductase (NADPH) [Candidatus Nanohalobium constans]
MSEEDVRDLIVVGGASAAQSAAIYAVRSGIDVTVIADEYGGQINNTDVVENYLGFEHISGPELADKFLEHMREYDVEEEKGFKVTDIRKNDNIFEVEREDGEVFHSYSVIIATGGSRRKLGVSGEEEFANKGVGYCAVCDGPLYKGETVAVIGGGYAGTEAADYLSDIAEKVYVLSRSGVLKGEQITIDKVEEDENVEVLREATAEEFYGDNLLEGLKYDHKGEMKDLEVTGAFIEIGTKPNSQISDLVETTESERIKVDEEMKTGTEGLYAAGDVNNVGVQQLAVSSGQGCQAGLNAAEYVKQEKSGLN